MSSILIVTASFPHGNSETFFRLELSEISKSFDQVTILPLRQIAGERRDVPSNVRVLQALQRSRGTAYAKSLGTPRFWGSLAKNAFRATFANASFEDALIASKTVTLFGGQAKPLISSGSYDLCYLYWGFPMSHLIPELPVDIPIAQRFHGSDLWGNISEDMGLRYGVVDEVGKLRVVLFSSQAGLNRFANEVDSGTLGRCRVSYLGSRDFGFVGKTPFHEGLIVVSCSRIVPGKRLERVACVLRHIANSQAVAWHHVGSGKRSSIAALIEQAGPNVKSTFHGQVSHDNMPELYRAIKPNLFVSLSDSEGISIAVLEAMSASIPVVSTDVGGMSEAVRDGAGLLIPIAAADDCSDIGERILCEIKENGILTKADSRAIWSTEFDGVKNARRVAALLKSFLSSA